MPINEAVHKLLGGILAPCVLLVLGSPACASGPERETAASAPAVEPDDPPAQGDEKTASGVSSADLPDPFAVANPTAASPPHDSRFTLIPVNLIYQGSYIPNVIADRNKDSSTNDLFLDSTLDWTPTDSAQVKARILLQGDVHEAQSVVSEHSDLSGLEYFYEQRFDDQSQTLTLGRKYLGWSSGFQWRPADLIQNGFTTKNLEIDDPNRYLGIDQVRYQVNKSGFNIDAVVSNRDRIFYDGIQSAVKLGFGGSPDISIMYARNGAYSEKYGVIFDTALPWSTTLDLEAVRIDVDNRVMNDSAHFGKTLESLTGISRFENIYLSLTKFIDDKRRVDLEFLYDGNGFKNAAPVISAALASEAQSAVASNKVTSSPVDTTIFSNQYIGRYYAYVDYAGYVDGWKLQWKPNLLMNIGDKSYIGSISVERPFLAGSNLVFALSSYHGGTNTEFGSISHGLGVTVSFVFPIL